MNQCQLVGQWNSAVRRRTRWPARPVLQWNATGIKSQKIYFFLLSSRLLIIYIILYIFNFILNIQSKTTQA